MNDKELFPRFSDAEYAKRYSAIRDAMKKDSLDAILISGARGSSEVHYLSNYFAQSPCWLLFPREGEATVFIHFFNPALRQGTIGRRGRSLVRTDTNAHVGGRNSP